MGWVEGNFYFLAGYRVTAVLSPICFFEKPLPISVKSFRGVQAW